MFGREPILIATALAAILQGAWMLYTGDITVTAPGAEVLLPILTVLAGLLGRRKVMPVQTLKDAGLNPEAVKARAADPAVPPHAGP